MYQALPDPYCYPNSDVLRNKPGLKSQLALDAFEAISVANRASEPLPSGRLSVTHYRSLHRHLFQDVYGWAGRYRTVRIRKGSSTFCYPENIAHEMTRLFGSLNPASPNLHTLSAFIPFMAHFVSELNAIHPFREGNGRAQLSFLTMAATHFGHSVEPTTMRPDKLLEAMIAAFNGDEGPLVHQIAAMVN